MKLNLPPYRIEVFHSENKLGKETKQKCGSL